MTRMTQPKTRGVIFSADEVRAFLDGRLSQFRRVIQLPDNDHVRLCGEADKTGAWLFGPSIKGRRMEARDHLKECYTVETFPTGTLLYVRETFCPCRSSSVQCLPREAEYVLLMDGSQVFKSGGYYEDDDWPPHRNPQAWRHIKMRPSSNMPQWASRIWLRVTSVRVERVQEISESDAKAEGFSRWTKDGDVWKWGPARLHEPSGELDAIVPWQDMKRTHASAYAVAWNTRNPKHPYDSNPYTAVYSVERIEPNDR